MRVAAICDIHGNLPALEAVLHEIRQAQVDSVVVGGDVVPGPMMRETLTRLSDLDVPVHFLYGNGERAVLAQLRAAHPGDVKYWGTTSGAPPPEPVKALLRWTAQQLTDHEQLFSDWPMTVHLTIPPLGDVLFCHATPRNETEIMLPSTPEGVLLPIFEALGVSVVVCGHTHMQFDRMIGRTRVVNAGSVGMPFGQPGADWLLLGPDVRLRHTQYDLESAADRIRHTNYPQAEEFAARNVLHPPSAQEMMDMFRHAELSSV